MQDSIFTAMKNPDFYPHPVKKLELKETHASRVFLTDGHVYKVKKAVNLGFLDFSTLEKRRHFCHKEVELNRRLSRDVYLGVVPITMENGIYRLGGSGAPMEYAVKMRRLSDKDSMSSLLFRSKIGEGDILDLARILADFYEKSASGERVNALGSWETVYANCEQNFQQTSDYSGDFLDEHLYEIIKSATLSFLRRHKFLFKRRIAEGKIRDCHGDLRTEHIYFTSKGIRIIDCIEFNDEFRYQDITSDIAFLAMDLDYLGFPGSGKRLVNSYAELAKDKDVYVLLDFYKCYRAFVRCKVNCLRIAEGGLGEEERNRVLLEADKHLSLAYRYAVRYARPFIWIVCGLPASGKSTLANELSKVYGIKALNSDLIRKELFGLGPLDSGVNDFGEGIYSGSATSLTYGKLLGKALEELNKGNPVILDATFGSVKRRSEAIRLARDKDANILFLECESDDSVILNRLRERENRPSVSDARENLLVEFRKKFEPLLEIPKKIRMKINTEEPLNECMGKILAKGYDYPV